MNSLSNLNGLLRDDEQVLRHHLASPRELGKTCAQVHFGLELIKDLLVVEVSVRKQPIQATHNVVEVFSAAGGDGNSGVEIIVVLNYASGVVQGMDHVVDC